MAIQKGSTVWLKTGGPAMSVQHLYWLNNNNDEGWMCSWFDENNKVHEHAFVTESLTEVNPFPSAEFF